MALLLLSYFSVYANVFGYNLQNGIDVIYTWNHSTATTHINDEIKYAKENWEYPGWWNPIDFVAKSTNSPTNMDFWAYPAAYFDEGVVAYTQFFQTGYRPVSPAVKIGIGVKYHLITKILLLITSVKELSFMKLDMVLAWHTEIARPHRLSVNVRMEELFRPFNIQTI